MSGTGARRYGVEASTPELEQRLRRIEQVLTMKADANSYIDDPAAANRNVPMVFGLEVTKDINKWSLTWDAVDMPDLRKYEIKVATDVNFHNDVVTYDETEVGFIYPAAGADVSYFAKVRAMNKDQWTGPWSAAIDVQTGLVTTSDLEPNAATGFTELSYTARDGLVDGNAGWLGADGFGLPFNTQNLTDTYGPLTIPTSSGSLVLPFVMLDCKVQSIYGQSPRVPLITDNFVNKLDLVFNRRLVGGATTTLQTLTIDFYSSMPYTMFMMGWFPGNESKPARGQMMSMMRLNVPLVVDQPGAGTHEYEIVATVDSGNLYSETFLYIIPVSLKLRFFEHKV